MRGKKPTVWEKKIQPRLEKIREWRALGLDEKQIYETKLKISHSTFYKCKAEHKELAEALEIGLEECLDDIEKSIYQLAKGGIKTTKVKKTLVNGQLTVTEEVTEETLPYFHAAKWVLENKRPDKWKDKTEVSLEMNDVELTSMEDVLKKKYAQDTKQ